MFNNYHKILGISPKASVDDVKKAYRQKAKLLHPDRNKSSNAHEQFILLSEAYEYALNLNTGRIGSKPPAPATDWQTQKREEARQRAREHAKMQYEEYIKTDFYKNSQAVLVVWTHLYPVSSLLLIVGLPALGYFTKGTNGLVLGLVFVLLTTPYWLATFREKHNINFKSLKESVLLLSKTKAFHYSTVTLMNIYLLFHFTLNTDLSTYTFLLIAALLAVLSYLTAHVVTNRIKFISRTFFLSCIVPYIFNLFFLINYIFSSNPTYESYALNRFNGTTYIHLENDKYEYNHWFRLFFDYNSIRLADKIIYRFEDGLLDYGY
jgi:hypothetical protein